MQLSIADYLIDIVQNSIEAQASLILLDIVEDSAALCVCIGDNGCGMDEKKLQRVRDPFFTDGIKHSHRKVGLGIPFLVQSVEATGGTFDISSKEGEGTSLSFTMNFSSIDCPPFGDLPGAFRSLMIFDGEYELAIMHKRENKSYSVTRSELRDALGSLNDAESLKLMGDFFTSQEEELLLEA